MLCSNKNEQEKELYTIANFITTFVFYSIFHKTHSQVSPSTGTVPMENSILRVSRHLLDDSVLEDKLVSDTTSIESSDCIGGASCSDSVGAMVDGDMSHQTSKRAVGHQGCVRRKTVLKDGRKPAVASWQRYWLQIWANSLVYFPPKSFKGYVHFSFY